MPRRPSNWLRDTSQPESASQLPTAWITDLMPVEPFQMPIEIGTERSTLCRVEHARQQDVSDAILERQRASTR